MAHRKDFNITKNSVVCCKYFDEVYTNKEGVLCEFLMKRPKLKPGAVSHIFNNQPKYFTTPLALCRKNPEARRVGCPIHGHSYLECDKRYEHY